MGDFSLAGGGGNGGSYAALSLAPESMGIASSVVFVTGPGIWPIFSDCSSNGAVCPSVESGALTFSLSTSPTPTAPESLVVFSCFSVTSGCLPRVGCVLGTAEGLGGNVESSVSAEVPVGPPQQFKNDKKLKELFFFGAVEEVPEAIGAGLVVLATSCCARRASLLVLLPFRLLPVRLFLALLPAVTVSSVAVAPVKAVEVADGSCLVCDDDLDDTFNSERFFFGFSGTGRLLCEVL